MRRGRPPYPDLLTPREHEVMRLLREGLTNREIAERLGISLNGARYHVSEILSKLGVSSREEAARWQPDHEGTGRWFRLGRIFAPSALFKGGAAGVLVTACTGLALLAVGVLAMDGRDEDAPSPDTEAGSIVSGPMGKLVYVDDGDIWTKQLPDGTPQRLTTDGRNFAPHWSPSGAWILFEKPVERAPPETWVMAADGSKARLIAAVYVAATWSPVADRLAYTDAGGLVIEDPDGANRTVIVQPRPLFSVSTPVWSPDGQWIAYALTEGMPDPTAFDCCGRAYVGLWASRADGIEHRERMADRGPPRAGLVVAGWTPDSKWMFFDQTPTFSASYIADGLKWRMMPLDPNDKTNGGSSVTTGFYVLDYSDFVDFSPDGTKMAVVNGPGREASRQKSLDVIDLTANYGGGQITRPGVAVASPSWSPDGSTIAYVQQPEGPYQDTVDDRRIWLIAADGTNARRLTKGETAEERPQWSADGRFILFVRREPRASVPNFDPSPGSGISLWRHEVATGNEELLLNDIEFQVSGTGTNIGYYGHYDWDRIFDWHQ